MSEGERQLERVIEYISREVAAIDDCVCPTHRQMVWDYIDAALIVNARRADLALERLRCPYCKQQFAEVSGVGGLKCVECEDMLMEG